MTDKEKLDLLRDLMGHVEDGSNTTVSFWQDDATGEFFLIAGNLRFHSSNFNSLFEIAKSYQNAG